MKKIINILETNKYSINIESDYKDKKKINNYYPTYKNLRLIEKFLEMVGMKKSGSVLLSGAYGTGKSYLMSIILNILDGSFDLKDYKTFLEKGQQKYDVQKTLKKYQRQNYLILFGDDSVEDYWQSILLGIYRGCKREGISLNLSTEYEIIEKKILKWSEEHKETYNSFIEKLRAKNLEEDFFRYIKEKDKKALDVFSTIYSEIFAGEKFVSLEKTLNIKELVKDVEVQAKNAGYDGVIYVFDEFGRYLETGINNIDVKEIQDMSEYCNEENNSNMFLITHKDLFQYTNKLRSQDNLEEWEKVSGRFLKEHMTYEKVNVLDILSDMLVKHNYEGYREKNLEKFRLKEGLLRETGMASEEEEAAVKKYYPLDYIGANILPDLSQKLAQNERTLFAYVCGEEEMGLKNTISNTKDKFIGLDSLYDYFQDNFKFLASESQEYKVYINSKNLLGNITKDDVNEEKFIKSLAIIYIYNKFSELEPTPEVMKAVLNIESLDDIVEKLCSKNLVGYRKHYNHFKLTEDIDVNVDREIKEYAEKSLGSFEPMETLEKYVKLSTYYPLKYNEKYKVTRYLGRYYVDAGNIGKLDDIVKNTVEDSRIIYLTNIEGNKNYNKISKGLSKQGAIVISNENNSKLDILELLKELEVISRLEVLDTKYQEEGVLKNEIETYKGEVIEKLEEELKEYFNGGLINGKIRLNTSNLIDYTCEYLEGKYPKYVGVNYELINKNNLTFPMKKARYDVLSKLQKQEILDDEAYFGKTTAEGSVARILLKNTGVYRLGQIIIEESCYSPVYLEILDEIKKNKVNLNEMYKKYTSNCGEYGIRKGIFTFILGLLLIKNNQFIGLNLKSTQSEMELDLKILDDIEKNPARYEISYYPMGAEEIGYIQDLCNLFELYLPRDADKDVNRVLMGMKNYVISLPRYTNGIFMKEYKKLNKLFSGIFSVNNGREFTLREIPRVYRNSNLVEVVKDLNRDLKNLEKMKLNFVNELADFIVSEIGLNGSLKGSIKALKGKNTLNDIEKYILTLEDYKDEEILLKVTERVKGFSYENWRSKKDIEDFKGKFVSEIQKKGKDQIEVAKGSIDIQHKDKIISVDMNFKDSMHGKLLRSKLEGTLKNMGQSIPEEEKKKILMQILLKG